MGTTQRKSRPAEQNLAPFLDPLQAIQNLLSAFGEQGVIIGGIAVSLLGKPRFTADVDAVFLLELEELPHLLKEAAAQGIEARITNVEAFARQNRILLLRHAASGIDIDISLGILPFESEMVARSQYMDIGNLQLRLPTAEDLIILKAVAHRPKDLLDIEAIVDNHPKLDKERIRYWIRQFAEALEMPELWDDLETRLK
ncbi:MAG: nucleotidyltransferase [Anaerolineae bacterium]|nr:nucleotidyltransferase [Anaerolineae bacterium]